MQARIPAARANLLHTPVAFRRRVTLAESTEPTNADIDADATAVRDRDWVARICTGDVAAFEAMFRAYKNDLGAFIESYVRSRAVAEELLQELFLHVWDQRFAWHVPGPLNAYLFRAARNRSISYLRRERLESRFCERLLQEQSDQLPSLPLQAPSSYSTLRIWRARSSARWTVSPTDAVRCLFSTGITIRATPKWPKCWGYRSRPSKYRWGAHSPRYASGLRPGRSSAPHRNSEIAVKVV